MFSPVYSFAHKPLHAFSGRAISKFLVPRSLRSTSYGCDGFCPSPGYTRCCNLDSMQVRKTMPSAGLLWPSQESTFQMWVLLMQRVVTSAVMAPARNTVPLPLDIIVRVSASWINVHGDGKAGGAAIALGTAPVFPTELHLRHNFIALLALDQNIRTALVMQKPLWLSLQPLATRNRHRSPLKGSTLRYMPLEQKRMHMSQTF